MKQQALWGESAAGLDDLSEEGLLPIHDVKKLSEWFSARLKKPVQLVFTSNRSTMMSWRERNGALILRLHQIFLQASIGEMSAVVEYIRDNDRDAAKLIDIFIAAHSHFAPVPVVAVKEVGEVHHLGRLFEQVNRLYFHTASTSKITWGASGSRTRRRSIQLGCYVPNLQLIRIHPCLDQSFVPDYYISGVIFHEMLHEVFGTEHSATGSGRRSVHPPAFCALEETFPDFERCKQWEQNNLARLLRFRAKRS